MKKIIILLSLVVFMLALPLTNAQTGSLAVWENIADGTLLNTWIETDNAEWTPDNFSGIWLYNFTSDSIGNTINNTIIGDRWYQTFEVNGISAEAGVMAVQTHETTAPVDDFYAVIYYLDGPATAGPEAYIIYVDGGTTYYWNGTDGFSGIGDAENYAGQEDEFDYYSGYIRVKAFWNWEHSNNSMNCRVRFKLWDPTGDEPLLWLIDDEFPYYGGATNTSYYPGIGADHTVPGATTTSFRRIFFWNLSYDYYLATTKPYIGCPQYDAETLLNMVADFTGTDIWNYTQLFKTMVNMFDLTSFYDINYAKALNGGQNDTIYIFSVLTTGWEDFFYEYFDFPYPGDVFPNNILVMYMYETIDGTPTDSSIIWNDFARVRFDFNNDGYTADDYTFVLEGDGGGTLFGYHGWNQVIPDSPAEWYGAGNIAINTDDTAWGTVFRDYPYPGYVFFLNWDLISGETDAGVPVNISISFYDNETGNFCVWQDWNESNDVVPLTPASDNQTWKEPAWNTTTSWGIFMIEGGHLDFEDPFVSPAATVGSPNFILVLSLVLAALFLIIAGFKQMDVEGLIMLIMGVIFVIAAVSIVWLIP